MRHPTRCCSPPPSAPPAPGCLLQPLLLQPQPLQLPILTLLAPCPQLPRHCFPATAARVPSPSPALPSLYSAPVRAPPAASGCWTLPPTSQRPPPPCPLPAFLPSCPPACCCPCSPLPGPPSASGCWTPAVLPITASPQPPPPCLSPVPPAAAPPAAPLPAAAPRAAAGCWTPPPRS